jgi:hypothetical protein
MGIAKRAELEAEESDWMRAHMALSRLARGRALADAEEGRWLLAARRSAAHVHLGFGSFGEYIERLFGYTSRSIQEKLRVAEALEELPRLAQALETGSLSWSALRELTRVAVADTQQQWLELAQGKTARQLEELVAGKSPGDLPSSTGLPAARRHVLRFEVAPETFALFREAITWLRRRAGDVRDDDSVLLSMARHVLGGPVDEGRSSYQIALAVCPACGAGQQQASGELVSVAAEVVAMAHCDGQLLGRIARRAANQNAGSDGLEVAGTGVVTVPGVAADALQAPSSHPDSDHAVGEAHVHPDHGDMVFRDTRGATDHYATAHMGAVGSGKVGETDTTNVHVENAGPGTSASGAPARCAEQAPVGTRAKQTIPPALRRAVLARDQHRCRAPGCRNATFVDLHHIQLRSEGGRNELENLVTICGSHHRAVHRGVLLIEKDATLGVRFRHADGPLYGNVLEPQRLDLHTKLFLALRHLGFKEREVRPVLAALAADPVVRGASLQALLREALRRLRPG